MSVEAPPHVGAGAPAVTARPAPCARCHSLLEPEDLRCPVCALPVPFAPAQGEARTMARILRCEHCAAAVNYDVSAQAPKCDFCQSVMHLEEPDDPVEEAQLVLPFAVSSEEAAQALRQWLRSQGFFAPSSLSKQATLASMTPLWWAAWWVQGEALVSFAGDSEAGRNRASWAPHCGQTRIHISQLLLPATKGLTHEECQQLISAYRLQSGQAAPQGADGARIERFGIPRSAAREQIDRGLQMYTHAVGHEAVPGKRKRKVSTVAMLKSMQTTRCALPAYILTYRYRDRIYRALVHGQDGTRVVGKAPVSVAKIVAVCVAVLGLAALVIAWLTVL